MASTVHSGGREVGFRADAASATSKTGGGGPFVVNEAVPAPPEGRESAGMAGRRLASWKGAQGRGAKDEARAHVILPSKSGNITLNCPD